MVLTDEQIKNLEITANNIRMSIIDMLEDAGSGHTAGPLGMADIFTALYFHVLRYDPKKPDWDERDRLILSNGHIVPVQYATMAHAGYFPTSELATLRKFKSRLQGHPERHALPGIENTSGPLGSGLSQSSGMALSFKMDVVAPSTRGGAGGVSEANITLDPRNDTPRIYCLMSDGELQEGNTWEAVMFASAKKLDNLTAIIDRNFIQIDGNTENVMPLEPLADKWRAFNWHVIEIDGHNFNEIIDACETAKTITGKPTVIIAHTIPGKGIAEIEGDYKWHGTPPNTEQEKKWLAELRTLQGKIEGGHTS